MKKKKNLIEVRTIANGYTLKVEKEEYMYFNETDLLNGMLYHIGLKRKSYTSQEEIDKLIDTIKVWSPKSETLLKQRKQINNLMSSSKAKEAEISNLSHDLSLAKSEILECKKNNSSLSALLESREVTITKLKKQIEEMNKSEKEVTPKTPAPSAKDSLPAEETDKAPATEKKVPAKEKKVVRKGRQRKNTTQDIGKSA